MLDFLLPVYAEFNELLRVRLQANVFTTEDSIRYTFFLALIQNSDLRPDEIILEHPHPARQGAEVDMWIWPSSKQKGVAIEFKYDREIPSQKNTNKTQRAGKVFHDLYRLSSIDKSMTRVFIYVATKEMDVYFNNPQNNLTVFYNSDEGHKFLQTRESVLNRPKTFVEAAGDGPDINLQLAFKRALPQSHQLRIYALG